MIYYKNSINDRVKYWFYGIILNTWFVYDNKTTKITTINKIYILKYN